MASLLNQAPEVLHDIFFHVHPTDLASISATCRFLNTFITRDNLLWRQQYLSYYDCPKQASPDDDDVGSGHQTEWSGLVQQNVAFEKFLASDDASIKSEDELERIANHIFTLLLESTSSPTRNTRLIGRLFQSSESTKSALLCRSTLFANTRRLTDTPASTAALRQLSAKLHVFSGLDLELPSLRRYSVSSSSGISRIRGLEDILQQQQLLQIHPYARSRVYDLRRYKRSNFWGPFTDDFSGTIDWEKIQAIMLVIKYNLRMYAERGGSDFSPPFITPYRNISSNSRHRHGRRGRTRRVFSGPSAKIWDTPFYGVAPGSFVSQPLLRSSLSSRKGAAASAAAAVGGPEQEHGSGPSSATGPTPPNLDDLDPYGISGTWMRIVCFLDYSDLYNFNFETRRPPEDQEREPIDTREAFRLIRLKLHVTAVEEPQEGDHPGWPVVKFEGTSRSTLNAWDPNANSRIRGTVRTTPSGAIRWTTFSIFHNETRWRSEGAQIGGPRSARGVLGNWFDKDFDPTGPAGPTCFWKISDDVIDDSDYDNGHGAGNHIDGIGAGSWALGNLAAIAMQDVEEHEDEDDFVDDYLAVGDGDGEWGDDDDVDDVNDDVDDEDDDYDENDDGPGLGIGGTGIGPNTTISLADLLNRHIQTHGLGVIDGGTDGGAPDTTGGGIGGGRLVLSLPQVVQLLNEALNAHQEADDDDDENENGNRNEDQGDGGDGGGHEQEAEPGNET